MKVFLLVWAVLYVGFILIAASFVKSLDLGSAYLWAALPTFIIALFAGIISEGGENE